MTPSTTPVKAPLIPPRRKLWKLNDAETREKFEQCVRTKCQDLPTAVEPAWEVIKIGLLEAADDTCGWTKGGRQRHKETWWWN